MLLAEIFLTVMFIAYNYLVFGLVGQFLEKPKLNKLQRIFLGVCNTFLGGLVIRFSGGVAWVLYLFIATILLIGFVSFHTDKVSRSLFCMLACFIHVASIRSICIAVLSIYFNTTLFDITNSPFLFMLSNAITFLFLNIAIYLVLKFIPSSKVRIINQNDDQLIFMLTLLSVFSVYLMINSNIYSSPNNNKFLLINQLTAPIVILLGVYVVLFFSFKTSSLLGYKEKNEKLQDAVEKERQYRVSIDKDVFRIIEVNFSQSSLISGFEDYESELGEDIHDYRKMLMLMIQETVYIDDRIHFIKYSSPHTVVEEFERGITEISFDYRRRVSEGVYVWMHVLMVLMRDQMSEDVKGFVQIRNIDVEKKHQLELQYMAERDMLTGLYNKITTEKLIEEQLKVGESGSLVGVLFVIDIDNFKTINDRLGHLYGDAILSELSQSLQTIFREDDIVGRIGGDEFLVFAKGVLSQRTIERKAKNICEEFLRTYTSEGKDDYTVSSSIGIALFPDNGEEFETLFRCADAALYATKANGKNNYSFYKAGIDAHYVSTRTEIETFNNFQKGFKDNRIEYVFRLLYGSEDTRSGIESVLDLISKNFGFSRANIFEFDDLATNFNCVYEWCGNGIGSVCDNYIDQPLSSFDFIISSLGKSGGMFEAVPDDFPSIARDHYTSIGIKNIIHFSIKERETLVGVIAFQNCTNDDFFISEVELAELSVVCQVLSVFIAKQMSNNRELRHHYAIEAVMDNMNCISYVIDRDTYEVFYENQNTVNITGKSSIGGKCYSLYRGSDIPCDDCPLLHLSESNPRVTLELHTKKFDIYTKTSGTLLEWPNKKQAMLISSVDITEYKRQEIESVQREKERINETFRKQLNELLSHTKIGTWDWEISQGKVIYSEAWAEILGYKLEELEQTVKTWESLVLPEDLIYANEQIARHFRGEKSIYEAEFRMVCKDGSIIWAQDKGNVSEFDEQGNPARFVGVIQDVSRLKNAEISLKKNQESLDLAVNVAELGTWDWDLVLNKIEYNDEYLHMLGLTQDDMDGSMEEWEDTNHPDDLAHTLNALNDYISGETQKYECEIRMKHKDGHYIWTRDVGRVVERDAQGKARRIIGGHLNIDALKRTQEQLHQLAYFDELTGIPNLAKFRVDGKKVLEDNREILFVFIKIDIVNFKMVNDIFGNDIGDLVIKKVADLVRYFQHTNNIDVGFLARVHDDVFILFEEFTDKTSKSLQIFEDIFNEQMSDVLGNHHITFRYGRYFLQIGDVDVDHAIECTNLALSRAKANKITGIFDFDWNARMELLREVEIANTMQRALDNNEFVVFLQGKYSLIDNSLCGAESLARWKTKDGTYIMPNEFIPVFEQNGFVTKLDMSMFTQCCILLKQWENKGLPLIPISVNFSRRHLTNPIFAQQLLEIATSHGVDPKYLEIELTETIVMDAENDLIELIASLHDSGFQLSIDDFGTGYSSLGMLKNLDVDTIKLDRSFFVDAQENMRVHSVLSNMLNMIIDLSIKTVAEGVEEAEQVDLLRKLNCDIVQGFYFGRPIPADEFTAKIRDEVNAETAAGVNDKQKRFNLRKNNELLIDMMDSMPLAFTLWDTNLKIVQCNKAAATLVGFDNEDDLIFGMLDAIPEFQPDGMPSLPAIAERIQLAFETGHGQYTLWYFKHIDGSPIPCEVTLVRIVNKGEFMVASYVRDMRLQLEMEGEKFLKLV